MLTTLELIVFFSASVLEFGESLRPNASLPTAEFNFSTSNGVRCESWWNDCEGEYVCSNALQFRGTTSVGGCLYRIPETLSRPPGECVLVTNPHDNSSGECKFVNPCVSRLRSCSSSEHQCVPITSAASGPNCSSVAISPPPPKQPCALVNGSCAFTAHRCVKWRGFCNAGYQCGTEVEYYKFTHGPQPMCAPPVPGSTPPLPPGECIYQNGHCVWSNCTSWLTATKEANCQFVWTCRTDYDKQVSAADAPVHCKELLTKHNLPPEPAMQCKYNITSEQCQYVPEPCSTIQCPGNSRCVVHTSTGSTGLEICLPSCFKNNGGCGADQLCIVEHDGSCTNTPCSSVKCTEVQDYYASRCPVGKEYKECGTACPTTCETFGRFLGCPSICVEGCFCPEGLVEYRDRCVDPLECPALLASPPPLNPLPLPENAILVQLTITDMTLAEFGRVEKSLLDALSSILQDYAVFNVSSVETHAVMKSAEQDEIIVVVKITSGDVMGDEKAADKVVVIIQNNVEMLPVTVHTVSAATVHHEHTHSSQVRASPLAPLVPLAVVLALVLVMVGVVVISVLIVSVIKFKFTCKLTQPHQDPAKTVEVISWSNPPPQAIQGATGSDEKADPLHNPC